MFEFQSGGVDAEDVVVVGDGDVGFVRCYAGGGERGCGEGLGHAVVFLGEDGYAFVRGGYC